MYCRKCGNKLEDGALFCTACGARTEELLVSAPAPQKKSLDKDFFMKNLLSPIVLAGVFTLFFFVLIIIAAVEGGFGLMGTWFYKLLFMGGVSAIAVMTHRAKGVDLSIVGVISLTAVVIGAVNNATGSAFLGFIAAFSLAAVIGALNAFLIGFIKLPSYLVTLCTLGLSQGLSNLIFDNYYEVNAGGGAILWIFIALTVLGGAFAVNFFINDHKHTPLTGGKGENKLSFAVYAASALLACLLGTMSVVKTQSGYPVSSANLGFLIFAVAATLSMRMMDNKLLAIAYSLAPALVYATMESVFAFGTDKIYCWAQILTALLAIGAVLLYHINTKKDKELEKEA